MSTLNASLNCSPMTPQVSELGRISPKHNATGSQAFPQSCPETATNSPSRPAGSSHGISSRRQLIGPNAFVCDPAYGQDPSARWAHAMAHLVLTKGHRYLDGEPKRLVVRIEVV